MTAGSHTPGGLLKLIRQGAAATRADLVELTGLARSTVSQRVDALLADGLLVEAGEAPSSGGRPPTLLKFNKDAGVVLAADLGASHSRLAVSNLRAEPLATAPGLIPISEGPDVLLSWVAEEFGRLLEETGKSLSDIKAIGVGLPGPVEHSSGRAVLPPIMPGWDGYDVRDRLAQSFPAPVLVDNDVNIMALGEWWASSEPADDFLYVKIGTGIGSGLILGGHLHRGADGAAGDIGHIQAGDETVVCRCGNLGCLEASSGGGALARALAAQGYNTKVTRDVVALVRAGNTDAIQAVREAGRQIGSVLATIVNVLNPSDIVIGGDLAGTGAELLARIREVVYRRSTALSTRELSIRASELGDSAGITGAAAMAIEYAFSPNAVNEWAGVR
ncbi:MAG: ROK family transcriptional regulator [Acidimicrobiia bacterium]|nr:ROK family transcriptional regulator [Acidimicrobiia bacterium]